MLDIYDKIVLINYISIRFLFMFLVIFTEGHHDYLWSSKRAPPAKKVENHCFIQYL